MTPPQTRATSRPPLPLAILVWLIAVVVPATVAILIAILPPAEQDAWAIPAFTIVSATWAIVGAFVVTRRPRNAVGWLVWGVGALTGTSLLGQGWAQLSAVQYGGSLPGTVVGWWLGWTFSPSLMLALLFLPLLFPDGRLPSRAFVIVLIGSVVSVGASAVATLVRPGPLEGSPQIENPTGVPELARLATVLLDVTNIALPLSLPLAVAAAVVRYRRGGAAERQQLKWFAAPIVVAAAFLIAAALLQGPLGAYAFVGMTVAFGLVPVAIAIAILRHRLYDIDRIVGRTLAYAVVTAVLAAAFVATNLALQALLAGVTGSSTLITAASTLVVAALFQPLRRRVQRVVDRRFNRARVDGERVVRGFAADARDEVDLDRLRSSVVAAVDHAVAPAGAAVWLRTGR